MTEELYEMYQEIEKRTEKSKNTNPWLGQWTRRNPFLQQLMSQRFSMDFQLAEHTEEAALGAAMTGAMIVR